MFPPLIFAAALFLGEDVQQVLISLYHKLPGGGYKQTLLGHSGLFRLVTGGYHHLQGHYV